VVGVGLDDQINGRVGVDAFFIRWMLMRNFLICCLGGCWLITVDFYVDFVMRRC